MASPVFSIDAANAGKWQPGDAAPVNTTPTQPTPVAPVVPGTPVVSGQPAQPTGDVVPPGAAPLGAGMAPGPAVPTVAQARAGVPVAATQPMPPQQQGATPAQPTLAQRAAALSDRVAQGFGKLFGSNQPTAPQPSPEFLATEARFAAPPVAPAQNLFAVRKQAIARNY